MSFKRYTKKFDYNLVVIGAGSAGLVSAYIAATLKAKVALIEKNKMGGDCLNTGCVPSKSFIRSAKLLAEIRRASEFGLDTLDPQFDFANVMARLQSVIKKVEPHDSVERYKSLGVDCYQGSATLKSRYEVDLDGNIITARSIIIATGAEPYVPVLPGINQIGALTSETVWNLKELPKRLLILGGGPIGCELAQSFCRFGAEVTLIEAKDRILSKEDPEVSEFITKQFIKEGVRVLTSCKLKAFHRASSIKELLYETASEEHKVEFDEVLVALGRRPRTQGFGLEKLGIKIANSDTIERDTFLRTNFSNIYVCGDVAGPFQLTNAAAYQAWYAAFNALLSPFIKFKADESIIPYATFTDPEVARVGLNEAQAQERKIPYEVTCYSLEDLDRAITDEADHGFVRVLTPPKGDKILGVTIVGARAADIMCEFVTAMKYGLGLNKILSTPHIYPTFSEANKFVAGVWRKNSAPRWIYTLLEKFHKMRR